MAWLANFLINLAAQLSGFTNSIAAVLLTILAVAIARLTIGIGGA
jgi:hypothetical protein